MKCISHAHDKNEFYEDIGFYEDTGTHMTIAFYEDNAHM